MYFLGVTACLHHRHHGHFGKWTFRSGRFGPGVLAPDFSAWDVSAYVTSILLAQNVS